MKTTVINAGVPGDGTKVFLEKAEEILSLAKPPATVILSMGANDCINPHRLLPFPQFRKNFRTICNMIPAKGFRLINVIPPLILWDEFVRKYPEMKTAVDNGLEEEYRKYVDCTRAISEELEIPFLDIFKIFSAVSPADRESSLTRNKENCGAFDGIHPTAHGHILIGAMLYEKICTLHYPENTILCIGDSLTHGYPLAGMGTVNGENYPSALNRIFNEL